MLKILHVKNTAKGWRKSQPSLSNWKRFLAASVTVLLNIQDILCLKIVDDAFLPIYPKCDKYFNWIRERFHLSQVELGEQVFVLQRLPSTLTKEHQQW